MKKFLLLFTLLILSFILFLLFHDKGNEMLKPYLATYIESQLENNESVTVKHLKIDKEYIELIATINHISTINAQGDFSLLDKTLNIKYQLYSNGFKNKKISFKNKIDIKGTAVGDFDNIDIEGKGNAFQSKLSYTLNLKEDKFNNIKLHLIKADISELLLLASQPSYAKGKIDINVNIPTLEGNNTKGKAEIVLYETELNEKIIKRDFQIEFPKESVNEKVILTGEIHAMVSQEQIDFNSDIKSNLFSVKLSNAIYNFKNRYFFAKYITTVSKLSKLSFSTQKKLYGTLNATGSMQFKNKVFKLNAFTKSLGGTTKVSLNGDRLNIDITNANIEKILHTVGEKPYAMGKLSSTIKLSSLENLTGTFVTTTKGARTIHKTLKKELAIDLGKSIAFLLTSNGAIKSNIAYIKTDLDADLFSLQSHDMQYHLKKSKLTASYHLTVPKLSKLNTLSGKKLQGSLQLNGEIESSKNLLFTGRTKDFGGDIEFKLINQQLTSHINKISVQKLMYMLYYPQIFKASLNGEFTYNLTKQKGLFTSKLNQAQLLPNNLTKLIKQIRGVDLSKERYNQTTFIAKLNNNDINFNLKAQSKKVTLSLPNGHINKLKNHINAIYKLKIENKNLVGKIVGNISNPHITVDTSQFIQNEVINIIKDNIDDDKLNNLGLGKKETEVIKNILEDLFK